jgi:hypothetical protein
MSPKLALCATAGLLFVACSVDKQLEATGGSRSDGIIELSYEIGAFQSAKIDWDKAQSDAIARCGVWGYRNAARFGGEKRQCNMPSNSGCMGWFVTIPYQCTNEATEVVN